ncbi:transcription factor Maf-like isoform X2 [Zeugodacus cucurbitae]|uniref:transcription factor Maf-like isoform X2 n=1 Tax=Zeugodacus cucurbitae TaxID=28588 RepID=UPI0023D9474D|nr:transcription factor Maf-like isoform X2 [Zeugodacus cucurbitae]
MKFKLFFGLVLAVIALAFANPNAINHHEQLHGGGGGGGGGGGLELELGGGGGGGGGGK